MKTRRDKRIEMVVFGTADFIMAMYWNPPNTHYERNRWVVQVEEAGMATTAVCPRNWFVA